MNKQKSNKRKARRAWLLLSLAFCFMLCLFAPLDAYFGNKGEYWFTFQDLVPEILAVFAASFIALSLVFLLLNETKISAWLFAAFTVLLLFFYIQGNYIPRNYGVLNGVDIDWSGYTGLSAASIVLAVVCAALFVVLVARFRDKVFLVGMYLSVFLIAIQAITLGITFTQKEMLAKKNTGGSIVVTQKDMLSLSEDGRNIVVLMLDTFDGDDMRYLLETDEEKYAAILEDFTYYPDTLGGYPTTKGSLPFILTGVWYENEIPYSEYVQQAYKQTNLYDVFRDNGFTLDVYTENGFMSRDRSMYNNVQGGAYKISDPVGFSSYLYRLVAFNYMPHQLKQFFVVSTDEFSRYRSVGTEEKAFSPDVQAFYEQVSTNGFTVQGKGNLFKFYHLSGVHAPFTFGEDLTTVAGEKYTSRTEAEGNLAMLKEFLGRMREAGAYDNSAIIILADHGHIGYSQNPILLIKNYGESHGFAISGEPVTFEFLSSFFSHLAEGGAVDEEYISSLELRYGQRRYLYYSWDNEWSRDYLPTMIEMYAEGPVDNPDNLVRSGVSFLADVKRDPYTVGTELSFMEEATANPYCLYGFSSNEKTFTWTNGTEGMMKLELSGEYDNLLLRIQASPYYQSQYVSLSANGNDIGDAIFSKEETKEFVIPHSYVEDGVLELGFHFATPIRPHSVNPDSADDRQLALAMKTICLSSTDQGFDLASQQVYGYTLGIVLSFNAEEQNGMLNVVNGFSKPETKSTWTSGTEAEMRFIIGDVQSDLVCKLNYDTYHSQHVVIEAGDTTVDEFDAAGPDERSIRIPASAIGSGELRLIFRFPDARSPLSLGESQDSRELALRFVTMTIEAAPES